MRIKKSGSYIAMALLVMAMLGLSGCGGQGYGGGLLSSIFHETPEDKCMDNYSSTKVEGKTHDLNGITIKLPVDYSYAKSQQPDFNGANWQGGDSVRGIGLCMTEDAKSAEHPEKNGKDWENVYSFNTRWEYCYYTKVVEDKWQADATRIATSPTTGITVGGTSAGVTRWVENKPEYGADGVSNYISGLRNTKVLVYNPDNQKACVCSAGYEQVNGDWNNNWGPNPLARYSGASPRVIKELDIHTEDRADRTVIEAFFVQDDAELGPCELDDYGLSATSTVSSGNKCKSSKSSIDASSISSLALAAAYDEAQPNFPNHEMKTHIYGQGGKPTTELAVKLRTAATGDFDTIDCGKFVAAIMRCTVDRNYKEVGTSTQLDYCKAHPESYQIIYGDGGSEGGEITQQQAFNEGKIQPGDVFINGGQGIDGHTAIYTGFEEMKKVFTYLTDNTYSFISASMNTRGPKIHQPEQRDKKYWVVRFIGNANPIEGIEEVV